MAGRQRRASLDVMVVYDLNTSAWEPFTYATYASGVVSWSVSQQAYYGP